jgi:peptidoglycan/xylan/chitin deacetylase (PgdA/CDA1 family)
MKRLLKISISIIYFLAIQTSHLLLKLCGKDTTGSCIVLLYHSIPEDEKEAFDNQMGYLTKKTIPIKMGDNGKIKKGGRYSIVTLDDAFISAIENGIPILIKRKVPFTIFIPAGYLGKKPGWRFEPDEKEQFEKVATIEELRNVPKEYVVWGSHMISHPRLSMLDNKSMSLEIYKSKEMLESYFNVPIKYIAFPYGDYNESMLDLCKKAGYEQVFTSNIESPYRPMNKFEIGRIEILNSDWPIEYKLKILGAYSWISSKYIKQIH